MGSEVTSDPVVDGCRLGPGELCDLGDAVPSCHQEHRLNPAVGSDIGGATQGAGQSLPVAVIDAQFIWCSCSSHTQLRAKSIPRRTSGYLLSGGGRMAGIRLAVCHPDGAEVAAVAARLRGATVEPFRDPPDGCDAVMIVGTGQPAEPLL